MALSSFGLFCVGLLFWTFLTAGAGKLASPAALTLRLLRLQTIPKGAASALGLLEIGIALALVMDSYRLVASAAALGMSLAFLILAMLTTTQEHNGDCGCGALVPRFATARAQIGFRTFLSATAAVAVAETAFIAHPAVSLPQHLAVWLLSLATLLVLRAATTLAELRTQSRRRSEVWGR